MHLTFRNVNGAFHALVQGIAGKQFPTTETISRAGDVIQILEPVTITYTHPREKVLFNQARDANPFFHLVESVWMLAGRNDVAPLAEYNGKIGDIASDDGETFNGAYGYRWRHSCQDECLEEIDQLTEIIDHLTAMPESRRAVLAMWNVQDDLLAVGNSKDVCCNLSACFAIRTYGKRYLDMTVFNRSNDLVWGALGANVVHFAVLQEYLAAALGVQVGRYNQISNNLHVYKDNFKWKQWLEREQADTPAEYLSWGEPLFRDRRTFDAECQRILSERDVDTLLFSEYDEPWLNNVVKPMMIAFKYHKLRSYGAAVSWLAKVIAPDWREAGLHWVLHRMLKYQTSRKATDNPYLPVSLPSDE